MTIININATSNLPKVYFNAEQGIFEINGNSYPQDAEKFYLPLIDYIKTYLENALAKTILKIEIEYFQTTSQKFLIDIIKLLKTIDENGLVLEVNWIYKDEEESEDVFFAGKEIERLLDLNFNFIKK